MCNKYTLSLYISFDLRPQEIFQIKGVITKLVIVEKGNKCLNLLRIVVKLVFIHKHTETEPCT